MNQVFTVTYQFPENTIVQTNQVAESLRRAIATGHNHVMLGEPDSRRDRKGVVDLERTCGQLVDFRLTNQEFKAFIKPYGPNGHVLVDANKRKKLFLPRIQWISFGQGDDVIIEGFKSYHITF